MRLRDRQRACREPPRDAVAAAAAEDDDGDDDDEEEEVLLSAVKKRKKIISRLPPRGSVRHVQLHWLADLADLNPELPGLLGLPVPNHSLPDDHSGRRGHIPPPRRIYPSPRHRHSGDPAVNRGKGMPSVSSAGDL